jgi:hypothetical protein
MFVDNTKQPLERLKRGEILDGSTLQRLHNEGFILVSETPIGTTESLFIRFTDKGEKLLKE